MNLTFNKAVLQAIVSGIFAGATVYSLSFLSALCEMRAAYRGEGQPASALALQFTT